MSTTNAIGLMSIFMVDLVDIYFISLLHNNAYTAAIGYASAILLLSSALCVALTIANTALVAKSIGQQRYQQARQYVTHVSFLSLLFITVCAIFLWLSAPILLTLIGAKGEAYQASLVYLRILIPSLPALALSMQMSAVLRSLGKPKRAIYPLLFAATINALLDSLFIFTFNMGIEGAAFASLIARCVALCVGLYYVQNKHNMFTRISVSSIWLDSGQLTKIAAPAMLTQLATPLGNLYVTYQLATFGHHYIAGWAIIGRLIPVCFSVIFAVSGAISPMIAQNYGAAQFLRLRTIISEALKFVVVYCLVISLLLSFGQQVIIDLFHAQLETAKIIRLFCQQIAITFMFTGMSFVAIAFFNNLGYAQYATLFNLAKVCLGTLPFVTIGALYQDASGVLYGQALGNMVFALIGLLLTHSLIKRLEYVNQQENNDQPSTY